MNKKVKKQIGNAPKLPGVYIFKNEKDEILYVGKAKNLKKRLKSYIKSVDKKSYRIRILINNIEKLEYIVVSSENEALILENNLIKENQPYYNIELKDGKTYPYIKITRKEKYPRIFITRTVKNDGNLYFGPYTSVNFIRKFLSGLRSIFPYRHCRKMPDSVCLQYHIDRCLGPCEFDISKKKYMENINQIQKILKGKGKSLYKELERKMKKYAENHNFEKAAQIRDQIKGLQEIIMFPQMESYNREDKDIFAIINKNNKFSIYVLNMKDGKIIDKNNFIFDSEEDTESVLYAFLNFYYENLPYIPERIYVNERNNDFNILEKEFEQKREYDIQIIKPEKDQNEILVKRAEENAKFELEKKFFLGLENSFHRLKQILNLDKLESIDAFDISNYGKEIFVGASIRIKKSGYEKNKYRHFNIHYNQQDDFRMIKEIVYRRYKNNDTPDLILIDGGPIQLRFAKKALNDLNIEIPILSIAKKEEKIYLDESNILEIDKNDPAKLLLIRARDEVHRFVINHNRKKKRKSLFKNPLRNIGGIGKSKAKTIINFFDTLDNLKRAGISEIKKVPGIGEKLSKQIYYYFHPQK